MAKVPLSNAVVERDVTPVDHISGTCTRDRATSYLLAQRDDGLLLGLV
jgi:hypothetical protein